MGLVDYSSDEDDLQQEQPDTKRRRIQDEGDSLPVLPDSFKDMYAVTARTATSDDPRLHQGRKRTIPHAEGNWPTHVYLEWTPSAEQRGLLANVISAVSKKTSTKLHSSLQSDLGVPLPLHISLSAPLVLRTEQRHEFLEDIQKAVAKERPEGKNTEESHTFSIRLNNLRWAANYERNRWFLAFGIQKPPEDNLNKLLMKFNDVAMVYALPSLYVNTNDVKQGEIPEDFTSRFHFSVAWSLETPVIEKESFSDVELDIAEIEKLRSADIEISTIKVKIGSTIQSVHL